MFLVNSRLGRFAATRSCFSREDLHTTRVLLLPKLRSYFAEFLNEGYLAHLDIFYPPTCVGFSTDTNYSHLEAFLVSEESITSAQGLVITSQRYEGVDLLGPSAYELKPQSNKWLTYPAASPHR